MSDSLDNSFKVVLPSYYIKGSKGPYDLKGVISNSEQLNMGYATVASTDKVIGNLKLGRHNRHYNY